VSEPTEAQDHPDDDEPFEVLMSGSGPERGHFNGVTGFDVVFPDGRPDPMRAERFLSGVISRHHDLVDAFADALRRDDGSADAAAADLEDSILSLSVARSLHSPDPSDGADDVEELDVHSEWLDDNLDVEDTTPPEAEIPVAVELGTVLHDGHVSVRARQALVHSTGFVLTLDIAMRAPTDFTREERHAVDTAFNDLAEKISVDPASGLEASPHSGWCRVFHRSAVGWGEVWVEGEPAGGPIEFRLSAFAGIDEELTFAVDAARIVDARTRVIDVSGRAEGR
jgi:hypothetical protein